MDGLYQNASESYRAWDGIRNLADPDRDNSFVAVSQEMTAKFSYTFRF